MSKVKIQITHWITGSVLFEYETEDNTIAKTLHEANLYGANLRGADLYEANLHEANLYGANLRGANLCGANLRGADLYEANLCGADLYEANLCGANLCGANLCGANLCGANLHGANLCGANNAELAIAMTRILPEGQIIGWKKCQDDVIVKLQIPAKAKRSHAFGRKCRAEYAKVLQVIGADEGIGLHDNKFIYRKGEIVRPDSFDDDWTNECSGGIHFFITKEEAQDYS